VHTEREMDIGEMTEVACGVARREGLAETGQMIVALAGVPFGTPGTTNLMRIAMA
jgi:pyruvate kinase